MFIRESSSFKANTSQVCQQAQCTQGLSFTVTNYGTTCSPHTTSDVIEVLSGGEHPMLANITAHLSGTLSEHNISLGHSKKDARKSHKMQVRIQ